MITSITTKKGRVIHVAPDNEPVFNLSEIAAMKGLDPDAAELAALVKEIFPGARVVKTKSVRRKNQPSCPTNHEEFIQEEFQMAKIGFNAAEAEEMDDFSPIPADDYLAAIVESEMCETAAKTGHYLKLKFSVLEGPFANRVLFANLNLDNPNQTAVDIARSELKSICSAIGKGDATIDDSEELHDHPLMIKVVIEDRKDKPGEKSNRIKKYSAAGGVSKSTTTTRTTTSAGSGAGTGAKKRPWEK